MYKRFASAPQVHNTTVGLMSAQSQYLGSGGSGEFIFGYGELNEIQIQIGVQRLAQAID